jgi:hypothetical protein
MPSTTSDLNWRATKWATITLVAALVVAWTPFLIWPPNKGSINFALIAASPGIAMLIPGVLIAGAVRGMVWVLFHQADFIRSTLTTSGDTYFVIGSVGMHLSFAFVSALFVDWILYFLIAREVIKARAKR